MFARPRQAANIQVQSTAEATLAAAESEAPYSSAPTAEGAISFAVPTCFSPL